MTLHIYYHYTAIVVLYYQCDVYIITKHTCSHLNFIQFHKAAHSHDHYITDGKRTQQMLSPAVPEHMWGLLLKLLIQLWTEKNFHIYHPLKSI